MPVFNLPSGEAGLVDKKYLKLITKYKWYKSKGSNTIYAVALSHKKRLSMHRLILGLTDPRVMVDHKDGNGLNNLRSNLRICNKSQNARNKLAFGASKYLGVCRNRKKWIARIVINGKQQHLGMFEIEEDAAKAYNKAAKKLRNPFCRFNIIN